MPYPMVLAIDTSRPPLRHVVFSDPNHLPTVAQLDVLVAASPTLERLELQECRGERGDRDLYPSTHGSRSKPSAVSFVRLESGECGTAKGLEELAERWNVEHIEELWVNDGVDLTGWLRRYGGGLQRLTCTTTQLAFYQQENILERWCGKLESLTLYLVYGGMNPGKLPRTVMDIQLITAKGATRETEEERSNYVEEFLEDVMTQDTRHGRRVRVDVSRTEMGRASKTKVSNSYSRLMMHRQKQRGVGEKMRTETKFVEKVDEYQDVVTSDGGRKMQISREQRCDHAKGQPEYSQFP